ncbi:MAG: NHLP bacteriocin export ABC transporter permease/ATPase subunit [Pleurocapsa sp. MO_226.B13]|nr:NHLP bacteriocin export ABC transporter permease/ATPase subunit [Pleurocapsa sp. MO_226.B13]
MDRTENQHLQLIIKGNQPLLLDDPQKVWLIESGSIALFAVKIKDGIPDGFRHYLFSLETGEALFGMAANLELEGHPYSLLATSVETAIVRQLNWGAGEQGSRGDGENIRSTIHHQLSTIKPPITLVQNWIKHFAIFPDVVPPSTHLDPSTVQTGATLQSHLAHLHGNFSRYLERREQEENAQKIARFQARERLARQVTAEAIGELASLIKPQPQESFPQDNPLLIAAGAVGRAMGIVIYPPAPPEDFNQLQAPIEAIARASGVRVRRVTLRDYWWKKDCGPLLAYTREENRPVALLLTKRGKYQLFDPALKTRTPVNSGNAQLLDSVAYMFYRSLPDKSLQALDLLQFALKGRRRELLTLVWTGIAATLLGMVVPQATAILIDHAIPNSEQKLLLQVGLGLLAASLGSAIFQLAQGFAIVRWQTLSESTSQAAIWDRLLNQRISFFRQYTTGDLQARVSAITQIRRQINSSVMRTIFTSFFSLLNLALLFFYNAQLALVALAVILVAMFVTTVVSIITRQKLRPLQQRKGEIFGLTVQLIDGVSKLRVAGAQNRAFAHWAKEYTQQMHLVRSVQLIADRVNAFNTVLPTVSRIFIFILAASAIAQSRSELSTGTFLAFNTAFGTLLAGLTNLSNTLLEVLEVGVLWERVQPILEAQPERNLSQASPGKLLGQVKLERVSFRYRPHGALTLEQITLEAQAGEFIALVGPSGSGKSTIIRLLLGFETPESGTIYYDGQDLAELDISAVRRQLGVVLQNSRLLSASIFENISSGALLTLDEAWSAARMAGLAPEIEAMPMGMHTIISEGGTNISGGQRQRLLIARALALKPRILIFDEATSALDNRTQAIVSQSIEQLQVTRIAIAHRLSTIRHADRIYVIEAGRIVQQGSFEELASAEGLFARIMARQMT